MTRREEREETQSAQMCCEIHAARFRPTRREEREFIGCSRHPEIHAARFRPTRREEREFIGCSRHPEIHAARFRPTRREEREFIRCSRHPEIHAARFRPTRREEREFIGYSRHPERHQSVRTGQRRLFLHQRRFCRRLLWFSIRDADSRFSLPGSSSSTTSIENRPTHTCGAVPSDHASHAAASINDSTIRCACVCSCRYQSRPNDPAITRSAGSCNNPIVRTLPGSAAATAANDRNGSFQRESNVARTLVVAGCSSTTSRRTACRDSAVV